MTRRVLVVGTLALCLVASGRASASTSEEPRATTTNRAVSVAVDSSRNLRPATGLLRGANTGGSPSVPSGRALSANITKTDVKGPARKDKVEVKYEDCDNSLSQCASARAGCITQSGNPDYFDPPTVTYVSVNDGPWQDRGITCGVPDAVTIPGAEPGQPPQVVPVQPPPVPTFAQIQTAFRELPFSKPSVTVEPKGMKTLKNLKTYYAAAWPADSGLEPGEVSKPVKLLSWTVEFKVAAQDYRYDFGDGSTSGWTTSTGGGHPEGDITHTYSDTGSVDVKVDARLTGQYRVNGGEWQDIATTANLQDEPVDTLEVLGTRTRLVDN